MKRELHHHFLCSTLPPEFTANTWALSLDEPRWDPSPCTAWQNLPHPLQLPVVMLLATDVSAVNHHGSLLAGWGKTCLSRRYLGGNIRGCDQWSSKLNPSNGWPDLAAEALTQRLPCFVQPQSLVAAETTKMAGLGLGGALGKLNPTLSFLPRCIHSQGCFMNAVLNSQHKICRLRVVGGYLASVGTGCCHSGAAPLTPRWSLTRLDETWKTQVSGTGRRSLRFATLLGSWDKCKGAHLFPGNKYHQQLLSNLGNSNSVWRKGGVLSALLEHPSISP